MIYHISLDMWNTLIKPNPEFSKARNEYLARKFGRPVDEVKVAYAETKQNMDLIALNHGIAIGSMQCYQHLVGKIDPKMMRQAEEVAFHMEYNIAELFHKHPPFMRTDTIEALKRLRDAGVGLNICSNTNFISGTQISDWMKFTLDMKDVFAFELYSDKEKKAKPHWTFFQLVVNSVRYVEPAILAEHILHIGDDWRYDAGATTVGMRYQPVRGVDDLPQVLTNLLNRNPND